MNRQRCLWLLMIATLSFSTRLHAQPSLNIALLGPTPTGNLEWLVEVTPDPGLFVTTVEGVAGSLAVELGISVSGSSFLEATPFSRDWPYANPGRNPFLNNDITLGTSITANDVYLSYGSDLFFSGDSVPFATLITAGIGPTMLNWGGHTIFPGSSSEYTGARLSQAGINFDGLAGSISSGGGGTLGDFDMDGDLDASDIDTLTAAVRDGSTDPIYDLNADGLVGTGDRDTWVLGLKNTWYGDANLDGEFNTSDLVAVFTVGLFEIPVAAAWADGDWNGDGFFGSGDFVSAFAGGGFEVGPRPAVMSVPEPSMVWGLLVGIIAVRLRRRC